jgi:hypothetical protein
MREGELWAKMNTDKKRLSYIEKYCFEKSQNYCNTGESRTEYWSWRSCFHKNCFDMSFTDPTSMVGIQLLNLWLLKIMLKCINNGVTTIKRGRQTTGNVHMIWSDESPFMLFHTSGRIYVWRTFKETYNPEFLVPTVKHGGRFCDGLGSNIMVSCWPHCYFSWPNYCKGIHGQVG